MRLSTTTFLFHIADHYFTGKVSQPFFAEVEYSFHKDSVVEVLHVKLSYKAFGFLTLSTNLSNEIKEAAGQHHAQTYIDPDDLKGLFEPSLKANSKVK